MKLLPTVVLMAYCGLLLAATETKKKATDRDQIQGTWSVVSGESKRPPIEVFIKHAKLTFKGDMATVTIGAITTVGKVQLDTAKNPKEITVTVKSIKIGKEEGKKVTDTEVCRGIYQLQGDTLKICMGDTGEPRPKKFSNKQDFECRCTLLNLKRDK